MSKKHTSAVILAAGLGSRLRSVTGDLYPKPLTPVGGIPLIERSLNNLKQFGVEQVVIVTGHHHKELQPYEKQPRIKLVYNPTFAELGSAYSLLCAAGHVNGPFYLLESDLLYEAQALDVPADYEQKNLVITTPPLDADDNVYYTSRNEILTSVSKTLPADVPEGVMTGIWALSDGFLERFQEWCERTNPDLRGHYETLLAQFSATEEPIHVLHKPELVWCEIDHEDHLEIAESVVLPKIQAKQAN